MTIDVSKAVEIKKHIPKAKEVLEALAKRARPRPRTDLRRLRLEMIKEGYSITTQEFMTIMKAFEKAGYGKIILGQGQNPPRFDWKVNYIELGKRTIESKNGVVMVPKAVNAQRWSGPGNKIMFIHEIRPGWPIRILLPEDITPSEANELANRIRLIAGSNETESQNWAEHR